MKIHRFLLLAGLITLLPSSSCHDRHHHDVVVVVEPDEDPVVSELEPNDDAFTANDLGFLAPGDHVVIRGEIEDCCDPFDGFSFVSTAPLLVEFVLESHDGGDLDLCVYDPAIDDFSLCFENGGAFEEGGFEVVFGGAAFHTVVAPFDFGSRYTLEIFASPLPLAKALDGESEAGDDGAPSVRKAESLGGREAADDERSKSYRGDEPSGSSTGAAVELANER